MALVDAIGHGRAEGVCFSPLERGGRGDRIPDIRRTLQEQVTATVRWHDCIERMLTRGCDFFIELGSGTVLAGLVQRVRKGTEVASVGDPESAKLCVERMRAFA